LYHKLLVASQLAAPPKWVAVASNTKDWSYNPAAAQVHAATPTAYAHDVPFDFIDIDFHSPGIEAAYVKFVPLFGNRTDTTGSTPIPSTETWGLNEIEVYLDRDSTKATTSGRRALSALEYMVNV
jgi:hypothetical protein